MEGLFLFIFSFLTFFIIAYIVLNINSKKKLKNENNSLISINLIHMNGLGLAENIPCKIFSYNDYYEFIAAGNSFKLNKSKITDVSIKSETDIQSQYVSSVGRSSCRCCITWTFRSYNWCEKQEKN